MKKSTLFSTIAAGAFTLVALFSPGIIGISFGIAALICATGALRTSYHCKKREDKK